LLGDWAEHCSQTEREAAKIELKADDIVLAHLLKRRLDRDGWVETHFEGQVLSLTRRGMFVLFDRLFQGYLPVAELPRDRYELNDLETALVGRHTGAAYKIADRLPVRVVAIDEARGRVDLTLAGEVDEEEQIDQESEAALPGRSAGKGTGRQRGSRGRQDGKRKSGPPRTRSSRTTRPPQARGKR
jgi:hypothetical protein